MATLIRLHNWSNNADRKFPESTIPRSCARSAATDRLLDFLLTISARADALLDAALNLFMALDKFGRVAVVVVVVVAADGRAARSRVFRRTWTLR